MDEMRFGTVLRNMTCQRPGDRFEVMFLYRLPDWRHFASDTPVPQARVVVLLDERFHKEGRVVDISGFGADGWAVKA